MSKNDNLIEGQLSRLKQLYGVNSDTDLGRKIGKTQGSISNAKLRGRVPSTWIVDAVNAFGVNLTWVATGEGPKWPGASSPTAPETHHHIDAEIIMIPLVNAVLSAGGGSFETSAECEEKYAFRSDFLRRKGNVSRMVLMRVDGDSMEPEIKAGDVVLIDQSQTSPRPGRVFAVGVEDMVYLKLVNATPGKLVLSSINEAYPPLEVDTRGQLRDTVQIVGRCVWSCRDL
jgi:phage repressor protein C with HTH and peptisase S24 domain